MHGGALLVITNDLLLCSDGLVETAQKVVVVLHMRSAQRRRCRSAAGVVLAKRVQFPQPFLLLVEGTLSASRQLAEALFLRCRQARDLANLSAAIPHVR